MHMHVEFLGELWPHLPWMYMHAQTPLVRSFWLKNPYMIALFENTFFLSEKCLIQGLAFWWKSVNEELAVGVGFIRNFTFRQLFNYVGEIRRFLRESPQTTPSPTPTAVQTLCASLRTLFFQKCLIQGLVFLLEIISHQRTLCACLSCFSKIRRLFRK